MNTVILNGSSHPKGNTATLLEQVTKHLCGTVQQFDAATLDLTPCRDCRRCKTAFGCSLPQDDMSRVFDALRNADRLILASPIWMESLTPPLLTLLSRLQPFFYHKDQRPQGLRKAGILLTGGGSGGAEGAYRTATALAKQLNVKELAPPVVSGHTDHLPATEDTKALAAARELALWLNT